jgi:hypothetical protein
VTVAPKPRSWDGHYYARFVQRVQALADRARDPVKEEARLRTAAEHLAVTAEHGREFAEVLALARRPLVVDLSAEIPQPRAKRHPPSRQPRPRSGSVRASAGARLRRIRLTTRRRAPAHDKTKPRGLVASLQADGTYSVSGPDGRSVPGLALTAAGALVEYVAEEPGPDAWNVNCICGHQRLGHFDKPEDVDGPCNAAGCDCAEFRAAPPPLDLPPGELTARSVLRFGDLVVGFARELAKK